MRILFVCLGNICRSPAAEAVFRRMAEAAGLDVHVDSAGTAGWHEGKPPYEPMIRAAALRGHDLRPLRARRFTRGDFSRFDLILGMDGDNIRDIEAQRPPGNATPVRRMLSYAPHLGLPDVPDPYYTRDFDQTLDLLEEAARGLLAELR
jgi:protein-tyrosine phosphatase